MDDRLTRRSRAHGALPRPQRRVADIARNGLPDRVRSCGDLVEFCRREPNELLARPRYSLDTELHVNAAPTVAMKLYFDGIWIVLPLLRGGLERVAFLLQGQSNARKRWPSRRGSLKGSY